MAVTRGRKGIEIKQASASEVFKLKDVCPSRALIVSGEDKSIDEILSEVGKDLLFYNSSDGGVTLSGGEPLSQGPELEELLEGLVRMNVDIAIETSLHVSWENIERCIRFTGTFLADLKHTDSSKFKEFTGGDSNLVMQNLVKLSECHENVIIRVPVIPGFNHTFSEIKDITDFAVSLRTIREIHFLPYHNLGSGKYRMLGIKSDFDNIKNVDYEEVAGYVRYAQKKGLIAKTGG